MKALEEQLQALSGLDAGSAAALIGATSDIALLIDARGVVVHASATNDESAPEGWRQWVGRAWEDMVTVESRPKVKALLKEAGHEGTRRSRQVSHPSPHSIDIPVQYSTVRLGPHGPVLAVGRDLRAMAAVQQRLVDAQQAVERDYARLRHMETRFRLLFQLSTEAVLIVDAATQRVVEANPRSADVLGEPVKRLVGLTLAECFHADSRPSVQSLLTGVRAGAHGDPIAVRRGGDALELTVSASLFRQEHGSMFLVRLAVPAGRATATETPQHMLLAQAVNTLPDGFVVTDLDGTVLAANPAFVEMTQLPSRQQVEGQSLGQWLGRSEVDVNVLLTNLRQHGSLRFYATTLRGSYGSSAQVEIAAVSLPQAPTPSLAFVVRDVGRRLAAEPRGARELPRTVSELTELVGAVPLREIVGETTDIIERLCIEAALELTQQNRASAAEVLGLSRQSLYVKLRRFGILDTEEVGAADDGASAGKRRG